MEKDIIICLTYGGGVDGISFYMNRKHIGMVEYGSEIPDILTEMMNMKRYIGTQVYEFDTSDVEENAYSAYADAIIPDLTEEEEQAIINKDYSKLSELWEQRL